MPALTADAVTLEEWRGSGQPTLRAGDLTLRPWLPDDVEVVVRAYDDPAISRWHMTTRTPDEAAAWVASWPGRWHAGTGADWAVTGADGVVAGRIGINRLDLHQGHAEFAYWSLPEARGRQVAPRSVGTLTDWLFGQHAFVRVALRHSIRNPASCRVAERAGFTLEGTLRAAGRHTDGDHDMHLHARVRDDPPPAG